MSNPSKPDETKFTYQETNQIESPNSELVPLSGEKAKKNPYSLQFYDQFRKNKIDLPGSPQSPRKSALYSISKERRMAKMQKIRRILLGFCSVFVIVNVIGCSLMTLILNITRIKHYDLNINNIDDAIRYAQQNLNLPVLMDIVLRQSLDCPAGYDSIRLGAWPGTSQGCAVTTKNEELEEVTEVSSGECDNEATNVLNIVPVGPKSLRYWKGMTFCAQLNPNFYLSSTCQTHEVKCGDWCIMNSTTCPITDITITNNYFIPDPLITSQSNFTLTGPYMYITKNPKSIPLIDIDISFDSMPCLDRALQPHAKHYYVLMQSVYQGCGHLSKDPRNMLIDIDWEFNFNSANNLNHLYSKLPNYINVVQRRIILLSQRSKYKLNANITNNSICENFHSQQLEILDDMDNLNDNLAAAEVIYSIFNYLIFFVAVACFGVFIMDKRVESFYGIFVPSTLAIIPHIVIYAILLNSYNQVETNIHDVQALNDSKCFSDNSVNDLFSKLMRLYDYFTVEYALSLCNFICSLVIIPAIGLMKIISTLDN